MIRGHSYQNLVEQEQRAAERSAGPDKPPVVNNYYSTYYSYPESEKKTFKEPGYNSRRSSQPSSQDGTAMDVEQPVSNLGVSRYNPSYFSFKPETVKSSLPKPKQRSMGIQASATVGSVQSQTDNVGTSNTDVQTDNIGTSNTDVQTDNIGTSNTDVQTDNVGTSNTDVQTDNYDEMPDLEQDNQQNLEPTQNETEEPLPPRTPPHVRYASLERNTVTPDNVPVVNLTNDIQQEEQEQIKKRKISRGFGIHHKPGEKRKIPPTQGYERVNKAQRNYFKNPPFLGNERYESKIDVGGAKLKQRKVSRGFGIENL
ncbi:MAG: hypothetical protein KGJ07_03955 [Patescibacteria group bacterium]|nr:hypothetical protein [Patescibacteria group bacterium]